MRTTECAGPSKTSTTTGLEGYTDNAGARSIEKFVRKNYLDVYRYLYHRSPSKQDARDLTQETFLKYIDNVAVDEIDLKGRAYLFTIARNVGNDFYRHKRPEATPITPLLMETLVDESAYGNDDGFAEIIAGLKADVQEILSLYYASGFGIGEIAEITGISRFSVRRKLKRALSELRDSWKESDYG